MQVRKNANLDAQFQRSGGNGHRRPSSNIEHHKIGAKSVGSIRELPTRSAVFKMIWKRQSHYGTTQIVPSANDLALARFQVTLALACSKRASLEEVRKMRAVMQGMRRSKLLKTFEVIFEAEEVKYQQLKQVKRQIKNGNQQASTTQKLVEKLQEMKNHEGSLEDKVRARLFEKIWADKLKKTSGKCKKLYVDNSNTHRGLRSLYALEEKLD